MMLKEGYHLIRSHDMSHMQERLMILTFYVPPLARGQGLFDIDSS